MEIKKYGTVERKVHAIVDMMQVDAEYLFMNWAQANVAITSITKPTIVYVLPPAGSLVFDYARVKDHPETQIGFLAPTEFDFEGEPNDGIIEQMKRLAIKFVRTLNESELFELIEGKVEYQVAYDYLDQNVTGVVLTLKLEEIEGVSICSVDATRDSDEEDDESSSDSEL